MAVQFQAFAPHVIFADAANTIQARPPPPPPPAVQFSCIFITGSDISAPRDRTPPRDSLVVQPLNPDVRGRGYLFRGDAKSHTSRCEFLAPFRCARTSGRRGVGPRATTCSGASSPESRRPASSTPSAHPKDLPVPRLPRTRIPPVASILDLVPLPTRSGHVSLSPFDAFFLTCAQPHLSFSGHRKLDALSPWEGGGLKGGFLADVGIIFYGATKQPPLRRSPLRTLARLAEFP